MKHDLESFQQSSQIRGSPGNLSDASGEKTHRKVFDVSGRPINRSSFSYSNKNKVDLTKTFSYNLSSAPSNKISGTRPVSGKSKGSKLPKSKSKLKSSHDVGA
jgi:hypothetical protein